MARVSKSRGDYLKSEKPKKKKDYNFYPDLNKFERNQTSESLDL